MTPPNDSESCSLENSRNFIKILLNNSLCYVHSKSWTVCFIVSYTLLFFFGFFANLHVILTLACDAHMRGNVTNILILNLAIADFLVIVSCIPSNLLTALIKPWILGDTLCKALSFIQGVSVCSSVYTIVAISMDRCLSVIQPRNPGRQGILKYEAIRVITSIWIGSILVYLPWLYTFSVNIDDVDNLPYCVSDWDSETLDQAYFLSGNLICCYILPLSLITIYNGRIWRSLGECTLDRYSPGVPQIHRRRRVRIIKLLAWLTFVFFICWLPLYAVTTVIKFFGGFDQQDLELLIPFVQLMGSINSCINPVLYAYLNKNF